MKKIKYLIFIFFLVFSFYFTDKVMIYIDSKNPIMQKITSVMNDYYISPVDAIIYNDTIIPGINGKEVNKQASLIKMEEFGAFNDTYLIYNKVKPNISLDDYKDKVIIRGNPSKRSIALILEENSNLEEYLLNKNIKYSIIATLNTTLSQNKDYINGEKDQNKASDLNSLLNKKKINKKICLVNYSNIDFCKNKKYFIIKPSIELNNLTFNNINNGEIILITQNTTLDSLNNLIIKANHLDLSFVSLSELIAE